MLDVAARVVIKCVIVNKLISSYVHVYIVCVNGSTSTRRIFNEFVINHLIYAINDFIALRREVDRPANLCCIFAKSIINKFH